MKDLLLFLLGGAASVISVMMGYTLLKTKDSNWIDTSDVSQVDTLTLNLLVNWFKKPEYKNLLLKAQTDEVLPIVQHLNSENKGKQESSDYEKNLPISVKKLLEKLKKEGFKHQFLQAFYNKDNSTIEKARIIVAQNVDEDLVKLFGGKNLIVLK